MNTIVGAIAQDVAILLESSPYNLFLGFGVLGLVLSLLSKWFKFRV